MTRLSFIVLTFALVVGLLPTSNHMVSMQTMRTEAATASQSSVVQGHAGRNSSGSCCDAMSPVSLACDFLVTQSACVPLYGGSEQVVNSASVIQSIYLRAASPPPKI